MNFTQQTRVIADGYILIPRDNLKICATSLPKYETKYVQNVK